MMSKIINDIKYFFERLFDRDGKPLLMLCIIGVVIGVLEVIVFLLFIKNATNLNIPFLFIYTYLLYFLNRLIIRSIQMLLVRFNIFKYKEDNFNYLGDDIKGKIRRHNNSVYIKERDRYEATIVYIVTVVLFLLVILTFVINANSIIAIIIALVLLIPFLLMTKEPYEIASIDVSEEELKEMTKKDFFEKFLNRIFKEEQITSPVDLPVDNAKEEQKENPNNNPGV